MHIPMESPLHPHPVTRAQESNARGMGACILDAENLAGCLHILHPLLYFCVLACQRLVQPGLILHGSPARNLRVLSSCAQALKTPQDPLSLLHQSQ